MGKSSDVAINPFAVCFVAISSATEVSNFLDISLLLANSLDKELNGEKENLRGKYSFQKYKNTDQIYIFFIFQTVFSDIFRASMNCQNDINNNNSTSY